MVISLQKIDFHCYVEWFNRLIYNMWLNTSKGISRLIRSKFNFWYFLNGCSISSILVEKMLKSNIAFLKYGNFIEDFTTDCWFWEKGSYNLGICTKVLVFGQFRGPFLHENTIFAANPSSNVRIKYCRFCEISKSTSEPYFEIFLLCIPITQNPVFRKWYLSICRVTYCYTIHAIDSYRGCFIMDFPFNTICNVYTQEPQELQIVPVGSSASLMWYNIINCSCPELSIDINGKSRSTS